MLIQQIVVMLNIQIVSLIIPDKPDTLSLVSNELNDLIV